MPVQTIVLIVQFGRTGIYWGVYPVLGNLAPFFSLKGSFSPTKDQACPLVLVRSQSLKLLRATASSAWTFCSDDAHANGMQSLQLPGAISEDDV